MSTEFYNQFRGKFTGILRWPEFEAFMALLARENASDWYIYRIGESPPTEAATTEQWQQFLSKTAEYIRQNHKEDYCGVIYVDDRAHPTMVKIFDPNNLGVVCGFSDHPPLPGWVLSRIPPIDLVAATAPKVESWWKRWRGLKLKT